VNAVSLLIDIVQNADRMCIEMKIRRSLQEASDMTVDSEKVYEMGNGMEGDTVDYAKTQKIATET
jgi:hypothetical protein